jgi:ketosteroid isomerase-like protein
MSEESTTVEPVVLARRTLDAANARDLDALLGLYASDAVWDSADPDLAGERFEGRDAIRRFFEEWWAAVEDMEMQATEIRDVGNGVVLSQLVQRGRPLGSTVSIEFRFATVSIWADGLIQETGSTHTSMRPVPPPNASPLNGVRRCRRTWSLCARSTRTGNAATSAKSSGLTLSSPSSLPTDLSPVSGGVLV